LSYTPAVDCKNGSKGGARRSSRLVRLSLDSWKRKGIQCPLIRKMGYTPHIEYLYTKSNTRPKQIDL
jgi:hypothetical protein